jgi:hypothetical protein
MPPKWMAVGIVAVLAGMLAACAPSPEQLQPADPLAGAGSFKFQLGGCSAALSNNPCPD